MQASDLFPDRVKTSTALEDAAEFFLDECDRRFGVLAYRGGHYVFVHRTFQEYLAAHWLSMQTEADQKEQLMTMLKNPSHWREVIRLFFNRQGKNSPNFGETLIEELGEQAEIQQDPQLTRLAAESLNDFKEYKEKCYRLHDAVKVRLQNLRDRSHGQSELFIVAGDSLGLINEPDIDVAEPRLVLLEPNEPFDMGCDEYPDEQPIHPVQLAPFEMGAYPVTNKEFAEFIKGNGYSDTQYWFDHDGPFHFDGHSFLKELPEKYPEQWLDESFGRNRPLAPVVGISWYEARAYCRWWTLTFGPNRLNQNHQSGSMRLPTEAEWEYACRAGTPTPFNTGANLTTEQANYNGNHPYKGNPKGKYLRQTTSVGSYPPNGWGLYDMHGNVWEWCLDWYSDKYYEECVQQGIAENPRGPKDGSDRVLRGGSWLDFARYCRSAYRSYYHPGHRSGVIGFRLVFVPSQLGVD